MYQEKSGNPGLLGNYRQKGYDKYDMTNMIFRVTESFRGRNLAVKVMDFQLANFKSNSNMYIHVCSMYMEIK
jgi:hypothetical protein